MATNYCTQIRNDWEEPVMSLQIRRSDFDPTSAEDPMAGATMKRATAEEIDAVDLPGTIEIEDD